MGQFEADGKMELSIYVLCFLHLYKVEVIIKWTASNNASHQQRPIENLLKCIEIDLQSVKV